MLLLERGEDNNFNRIFISFEFGWNPQPPRQSVTVPLSHGSLVYLDFLATKHKFQFFA